MNEAQANESGPHDRSAREDRRWWGVSALVAAATTLLGACRANEARTYNYRDFRTSQYDHDRLPGPHAGQAAIGFEATGLDGETVRLSDFEGKFVVLETGCVTCPAYRQHVAPMNRLAAKYPADEVVFLLLYVREAHPGLFIGAHESMEQKAAAARRLGKRVPAEKRTVIVDDFEGKIHRAYGSMPNMAYLIGPDGTVLFRSDWTHWQQIEELLDDRDNPRVVDAEHHEPSGGSPWTALGVLWEAGPDAVRDVLYETGTMRRAWGRARRYYEENGRLIREPREREAERP